MYCLAIKGPSGAGKSAVTRRLRKILKEEPKLGIIHGDYLSHLICHCVFSEDQLDLKYINMCSLIDNFLLRNYNLIIQDLFRRQGDLEKILDSIKKYTDSIFIFHLTAPLDVLLKRNRVRDAFDFLPEEGVRERYEVSENVRYEGEIVIDTSTLTIEETAEFILEKIKV